MPTCAVSSVAMYCNIRMEEKLPQLCSGGTGLKEISVLGSHFVPATLNRSSQHRNLIKLHFSACAMLDLLHCFKVGMSSSISNGCITSQASKSGDKASNLKFD
jgi:hypothetical protein